MSECRICFGTTGDEEEDEENVNNSRELIAPCLCNGTSRYVHRACLERWRETSHRAFTHCFECNFKYIVEYAFPLETYIFTQPAVLTRDFGRYLFGLLLFLLESFFFRYLDKLLGYPTLFYMEEWGYNTSQQLEILENDEIYSSSYYFSITVLFTSVISFLCFIYGVLVNVKRKKIYWEHMISKLLFYFICSIHFIWLHVIFGNTVYSFELFILTDSSCGIFNVFMFYKFLEEHNKIIIFINTQKNPSRLLEPPPDVVV